MRSVSLILGAASLAGCATFGEDCEAVDWRARGFVDGARGASAAIDRHACAAKARASRDLGQYISGWKEGVEGYCEPANGFRLGATGEEFNGVCNGPEAASFAAAFRAGESLFLKQADAIAARNAASDARRDLWDIRSRRVQIEIALKSPSTDAVRRRDMLAEEKALGEELARLEAEAAALAVAAAQAEADLAALRSTYALRDEGAPQRADGPIRVSY